jgi:hypothetical protein
MPAPSKVCYNCRQKKAGVKLYADDLLCPECYSDNERKLAAAKGGSDHVQQAPLDVTDDLNNFNPPLSTSTSPPATAVPSETTFAASKLVGGKQAGKQPSRSSTRNNTGKSTSTTADETIQPATTTDEIVPTKAVAVASATGAATTDQQVASLRAEVQRQQHTTETLQTQLGFVLSLLGITEQDIQPFQSDINSSDSTLTGTTSTINHSSVTKPLWSSVVAEQKVGKRNNNIQQSLIAAVYSDQSEQKSPA